MTFKTRNTLYTLVDAGDGAFLLSGHPKYCPIPTLVTLYKKPVVGLSVIFMPQEGPHKGSPKLTTPILQITP